MTFVEIVKEQRHSILQAEARMHSQSLLRRRIRRDLPKMAYWTSRRPLEVLFVRLEVWGEEISIYITAKCTPSYYSGVWFINKGEQRGIRSVLFQEFKTGEFLLAWRVKQCISTPVSDRDQQEILQ
eukprot:gene22188-biopygen7840